MTKKKKIQIYKAVNKGTFRGNDQSLYSSYPIREILEFLTEVRLDQKCGNCFVVPFNKRKKFEIKAKQNKIIIIIVASPTIS